ncbi:putative RNA-directed DNA polymerase, partial [Tanacetum coccineum]
MLDIDSNCHENNSVKGDLTLGVDSGVIGKGSLLGDSIQVISIYKHIKFTVRSKLKALKKPLRIGILCGRGMSKNQRSRIEVILNADNVEISGPNVPNVFVQHYEKFLGTDMACDELNCDGLFHKQVSEQSCSIMDRFGDQNSHAVHDFFINGQLLKEINHTFIALIPKVSTPHRINDYRPISCCNVIYKCISKILTNRIIEGIKEVVSDNQSAFVPGRRISDNILLTQELMYAYHRDIGPPRCAFKINIQKAYDTVDWHFMDVILKRFGFPPLINKWIMACVSSTSFLIGVNGDIHGFFKGKRGLRKGDPLSPFLFTLVMEVLTLVLRRRVRDSDSFRFHKHCEELQLINVCFADDLFIFARGDVNSARVIRDSLEEFTRVSGLVPSLPKSTTFFCNVANHVKPSILHTMPFSEGKLSVIYLGVPLIPTRLFNRDCMFLVEKARNRIVDWKNKSLSFAGRLQLCSSVISSMHVYWASVLMIPTGILLDIEQLMRGFLWCNGDLKRGKAKVAWNTICLPKCEGGLGIRSLEVFNIALMTTHIWNIV